MSLHAVVEGDTDMPVVRALARAAKLDVAAILDMGGKAQLDLRLDGFNGAAKGSPWLVLRDLDHDSECAPAFIEARAFVPSEWMAFRIAVREVEAWLLADAPALAKFLHIPETKIPVAPDAEADPTRTLVNLARGSTKSRIQQAMVPRSGSHAQVGPLYEATIIEFAAKHWSLDRACKRSPSLARARKALNHLAKRWSRHAQGTM